MRKIASLAPWACALWIAYIFLWYLQYKFTGHPGSTELFTTLTDWLGFAGHEKAMRIGVGSAELVAAILVLIRPTQVVGGALAAALMTGAIFFHVASPLGIDPYGDGGVLFKEACATLLASVLLLVLRREEVLALLRRVPWLRALALRAA